jgi:hypothetical protein
MHRGDLGARIVTTAFILGGIVTGSEVATVFPGLVPAAFDFGGFKGFSKRHGVQFKRD